MSLALYVQQVDSYIESGTLKFPIGVLPYVFAALDRQLPSSSTKHLKGDNISLESWALDDWSSIHTTIRDMATYACYRSVIRLSEARIEAMDRLIDEPSISFTQEEEDALFYALSHRNSR